MARPYRIQGEGYLYHITSRGDGRRNIYKQPRDYKKFLEYMQKAKERYKFNLYAYVLMPNHFHFLLETGAANLSKILHYIKSSYTTYHNIKYKHIGHLFQGRYKSILVERESYLLELTRYIHLNPVKAKLVDKPAEYQWSSYREYIKKNSKAGVVDRGEVEKYLSLGCWYQEYVMEKRANTKDPFKNVYGGFILGKTDFIRMRLDDLKNQLEGKEISFRKVLRREVEVDEIVKAVSNAYGKKKEYIYRHAKRDVEARKVAIYLSRRLTGLGNSEIGEKFGISYSAVSKAFRDVEKNMREKRSLRRRIELIYSQFKG